MSGLSKAFIVGVLKDLGAPPTATNIAFMTAWANREGGTASWNPWNTTLSMPGASDYNSVGVKNYTSMAQGMQATAQTLSSNLYSDIVGALQAGTANVKTNYKGLHNWSAGPAGAPNKGYWNLAGIPTSGLPATSPSGPIQASQTVTGTLPAPLIHFDIANTPATIPDQNLAPTNTPGALPTDTLPTDTTKDQTGTDSMTADLLWSNFQGAQSPDAASVASGMPTQPQVAPADLLWNNFQAATGGQ